MKKFHITLLTLLFIPIMASAQGAKITKFSGEQLRGIVASGAVDINLKVGGETGVVVELGEADEKKLNISVNEDKYVIISYGDNTTALLVGKKKRPKAHVTLTRADYIVLSGSTSLLSSGSSYSEDFYMNLSGESYASFVKVECPQATIIAKQNSKIDEVTVLTTGECNVETAGSANVTLKGEAESARMVSSGSSLLNTLDFKVSNIEAITSGTALIKALVEKDARATSSGFSAFKYTGDGKVVGDGKAL